jgi:sugar phosphate isomerase/epimerase
MRVSTYATWVGPSNIARACELARALGTSLIGAGFSGEPEALAPVLERHGVRLAVENHPETTPSEVLAKIERGGPTFGATVDTGWWATQGYDAARAIEELAEHVLHVHLKDVVAEGEPHETCRYGDGIVPVEACVGALRRIGYRGAIAVEHEPETFDPSGEIRTMREQLEGWLR